MWYLYCSRQYSYSKHLNKEFRMIVPVQIQMGYMSKNFPKHKGDDDYYEGSMVIGEGEFWYTITIMDSQKIEAQGLCRGKVKDDKIAFRIDLEKTEHSFIPLTDEEYAIFFGILAQFQARMWDEKTTQYAEELKKAEAKKLALMKEQCKDVGSPIIRTATALISLYSGQVKLLNALKFACKLGS